MNLQATTVFRGGCTAPTLYVATHKATLEVVDGKLEFSTWITVSKGLSTVLAQIDKPDFPAFLQAIASASQ